MTNKLKRADFMSATHRVAMSNLPRTHENCVEKTGVARPGKTQNDKANGAWMNKHTRNARQEAYRT